MSTVHIVHDPKTKLHIKDALFEHLYAPVQRTFKTRLDTLIIRNCLLVKASHKSFMYKGKFYSCEGPPYPRKANRLAAELVPEMESYLSERRELNDTEIPYVVGYINQVLNASNDLHDYLALLPGTLHGVIQAFIDACPCRTTHLAADEVQAMQTKNLDSIALIKQRMTRNLLL